MSFQSSENYFALFSLPREFSLDLSALSAAYRAEQQATHPDRFAQKSEKEQRLAMQHSSYVNEAYQTLKSPLKRAYYLLLLEGFDVENMKLPHDTDFLMEQLILRESLEELAESQDIEAAIEELTDKVNELLSYELQQFETHYKRAAYQQAALTVVHLQFLYKLQQELDDKESQLLDN